MTMEQRESMQLYVDYQNYITVEQVSDLLSSINQVYDSLFFIEVPVDNVERKTSTKLRVAHAETGSSIVFELVQGSQQIINAVDPGLRGVAGGVAILALTGQIMISYFRRGTRAWDEHQARKDEHQARELELRQRTVDVELKERAANAIIKSLEQIPVDVHNLAIDKLAETIAPPLALAGKVLDEENIVRVTLDNEVLKDSG